jgi:toxin CcdB
MSQFDVHRNAGRHAALIPFVVVVQSAVFDERRRRVVVPLVASDLAQQQVSLPASRVTPEFFVEGRKVILNPLEIVSVPLDALGPCVASLANEGEAIVAALDEVFSRAWG